jgi:hypothetical protein
MELWFHGVAVDADEDDLIGVVVFDGVVEEFVNGLGGVGGFFDV